MKNKQTAAATAFLKKKKKKMTYLFLHNPLTNIVFSLTFQLFVNFPNKNKKISGIYV